mmetsp:Transcript_19011/g.31100  ORF Transcript_19011/g.31100 Transcript_19011/m.31100 type:complete len:339 (+) Transcript_19011:8-1024(+)
MDEETKAVEAHAEGGNTAELKPETDVETAVSSKFVKSEHNIVDDFLGSYYEGGSTRKDGDPQQSLAAVEEEQNRKRKEKEEQDRLRRERIEQARAEVDEDENDMPEEIAERNEARCMLAEFDGDAFSATRMDNLQLLRAFFLVHGSKTLLNARSKKRNDGGRTLLHCASFWGSVKCLTYLLELGADTNATDTVYCKATPLLECARSGNLNICKLLLQHGANIQCQDACGDTVFHWCARKGKGVLIENMLKLAERYNPGSTKGVLLIKNIRGRVCADVAANQSVVALIQREIEASKVEREDRLNKLKKGVFRAKLLGGVDGGDKAQMSKNQKRRYKGAN